MRYGLLILVLLASFSYAQTTPAPQPGTWHCSILGIGGETVLTPYYDGVNTGTIYDRYSVPVYYDSDLGKLVLDELGGYTLTGVAKSGGYQYDAATGVISFTGFLGTLKTEYGYEDKENTSLVVGITADGTFHTCRLEQAKGGKPTLLMTMLPIRLLPMPL